MPMKRFSAAFPKEVPRLLKILGDSAMYVCASSSATSVQSDALPLLHTPRPTQEHLPWAGKDLPLISEQISYKAFCGMRTEIGED